MNELNKPTLKDIAPLIESGNDWQYEAILNEGPEQFKAFICSPRGNHCIGTFKTKQEADEAVKDAQEARWNG